jgi:hypothetical protein
MACQVDAPKANPKKVREEEAKKAINQKIDGASDSH